MKRNSLFSMCATGMLGVCLWCVLAIAGSAAQVQKDYAPFSDPKPVMPKQMLSDARLGKHVKVFSKSSNLGELLADMSKASGVKLAVDIKLRSERPIVYFHNSTLRAVLREVSELYGYTWTVSGKPGAYAYELREDAAHAKRRVDLARGRKDGLDSLLMDFTNKFLENEDLVKSLEPVNPDRPSRSGFGGSQDVKGLILALGDGTLRKALADEKLSMPFSQLTPASQTALCQWINAAKKRTADMMRQYGRPVPEFADYTTDGLSSAMVSVNRVILGDFGLPHFEFNLVIPGETMRLGRQWPSRNLTLEQYRTVAGWPVQKNVLAAKPIPEKPVSATDLRWTCVGRGVLLGDILEAAAQQTGVDIIADYYLQDNLAECFTNEPLNQMVSRLSTSLNYVCQYDGNVLRFRHKDWYSQASLDGTSADLLARLMTKLEKSGSLDMKDAMDIASLPESQLNWPGFRYVPGISGIVADHNGFLFLKALQSAEYKAALSTDGIPVSKLAASQKEYLGMLGGGDRGEQSVPRDDIAKSTISVSTVDMDFDSGQGMKKSVVGNALAIKLPSGQVQNQLIALPSPMAEADRQALIAQRKADKEAEKVELIK